MIGWLVVQNCVTVGDHILRRLRQFRKIEEPESGRVADEFLQDRVLVLARNRALRGPRAAADRRSARSAVRHWANGGLGKSCC